MRSINNDNNELVNIFSAGDYNNARKISESRLMKNPKDELALMIHAVSLKNLDLCNSAIFSIKRLISIKPDRADTWNELGILFGRLCNTSGSSLAYQIASILDPFYSEALCNNGNCLRVYGKAIEAVEVLRKALVVSPNFFEAEYNLALALSDQNKIEESSESYRRSLLLKPSFVNGWNNYGLLLAKQGQLDTAIECFQKAVLLDAKYVKARINHADIRNERNELDLAYEIIIQAICLEPDSPEAYGCLGNTLRKEKIRPKAKWSYEKSKLISRYIAETYSNNGNLLRDLNRLEDSELEYKRAISIRPEMHEAYYNLGVTYHRKGELKKCKASYEISTEISPCFVESYLAQAFLQLAQGCFEEGFRLYEWRLLNPAFNLNSNFIKAPRWDGASSISGKNIIIYSEQGYGDTIQFSRFAVLLESKGAFVTLQVPYPLLHVLSDIGIGIDVVDSIAEDREFDYKASLMSLPYLLETSSTNIPKPPRGIYPRTDAISLWKNVLGPKLKPRIGLVFRGNPEHVNDEARSISWKYMRNILSFDFEFHCLEKEIRSEDAPFFNENKSIKTHASLINSFEDTASLCIGMDLIISVDTSIAHLAASMGIETWIILQKYSDWRWQMDTDRSPWYPSVKLIRNYDDIPVEDLACLIMKRLETHFYSQ